MQLAEYNMATRWLDGLLQKCKELVYNIFDYTVEFTYILTHNVITLLTDHIFHIINIILT